MLRGKRDTIRGIVHVVTGFPLHFILYRRNLASFSGRAVPFPTGQLRVVTIFYFLLKGTVSRDF